MSQLKPYIYHITPDSFFLINPLSPNIHIQILQTDLNTFPSRIRWENFIKNQGIFSLVIILLILPTLSLDIVWILLGENLCLSLLGLKWLTKTHQGSFGIGHRFSCSWMTCTSSFSLIHNVLAFSFLRSQCHYLNTFLLRKQCTTVRLKRSKRTIECSRETSLKEI